MAVHFHKLKVKSIRQETAECVSLVLDVPEELTEEFIFSHGQNITLKTLINNEDIRRTYSICSSPLEKELRIAVKKADNGLFSTYINTAIKKGDVLEVLPPTGKFNTKLDINSKKNYIAFAAGSGITPILSIIKTTLQTEPLSSFTLLYGSRTRNAIIFFEELQGLKNKFMARFNLINILSREKTEALINYGRINTEKLNEFKQVIDYKNMNEFFICGPSEMIFEINDFLMLEGIDKSKIHFELFTTPGEKQKQPVQSENKKEGKNKQSEIIIKADGKSINFMLLNNNISILDAALAKGADLPFACKGGMCCSCKAKLTEGKVSMDVNYALEPEEIKQGFILCCQAHPLTEKVVIDFDVR